MKRLDSPFLIDLRDNLHNYMYTDPSDSSVCPPHFNPNSHFCPVCADQRKLQSPLANLVMFQLFNAACLTNNLQGRQAEEATMNA